MKRLALYPFRVVWRATARLREDLDVRLNVWFYQRIAPRVKVLATESSPGVEGLTRELARLQMRVDELEAVLESRMGETAKAG